jgi:multiple sugar transport system permease protein
MAYSTSQTTDAYAGSLPRQSWLASLRKRSNYLFVAPMLIYMIITMGYPILVNLQTSLYDLNVRTFRAGNAPYVGLDNYIELIGDADFRHAAQISLTFTGVSITLQFVIGFALALFFNRPFPGNGVLRSMLLLAWLLPSVVGGNLFRWMFDGDYGVINFFLQSLGLMNEPRYWLFDPDTALIGTIIANAWVGIPFNMLLLLAGLQNIPPTLYEAATVDGANVIQRFFNITLPLMRPVALGVILLAFIYTFKVFDLIYVMTAGGPVDATTVLPIQTYRLNFSFFRFGEGAAAATLLLVGLLFLAIGYARLIRTEEVA